MEFCFSSTGSQPQLVQSNIAGKTCLVRDFPKLVGITGITSFFSAHVAFKALCCSFFSSSTPSFSEENSIASWNKAISSPEPAFLLLSTKSTNLWPGRIFSLQIVDLQLHCTGSATETRWRNKHNQIINCVPFQWHVQH